MEITKICLEFRLELCAPTAATIAQCTIFFTLCFCWKLHFFILSTSFIIGPGVLLIFWGKWTSKPQGRPGLANTVPTNTIRLHPNKIERLQWIHWLHLMQQQAGRTYPIFSIGSAVSSMANFSLSRTKPLCLSTNLTALSTTVALLSKSIRIAQHSLIRVRDCYLVGLMSKSL